MDLDKILIAMPEIQERLLKDEESRLAQQAEARARVIREIADTESSMDLLRMELEQRNEAVKVAMEPVIEAQRRARDAQIALTNARGRYQHLNDELRKTHGGAYVLDTLNKLRGRRQYLLDEIARLEPLVERVVEMFPGYGRRVKSPEKMAALNEAKHRLELIEEALERATKLETAHMAPSEIKAQVESILNQLPEF